MVHMSRMARRVVAPAFLAGLVAACGTDDPALTAPSEVAGARIKVASITVTPARDTVAVGGTAQYTATVRDGNGRVVQRSLSWSSSATGIATVGSTGLVTGRAAGSATVVARDAASGLSGSASVLVVAAAPPPPPADTTPTPPPPTTASCATPGAGWIWCDDFEQDRLGSYFEYMSANGSFARAAGVGRNGGTGMRARFAAGQVEAGNIKLAIGRTPMAYFRPADAGTANYREIYWRLYVRAQPGWQGGVGYKLSRATILAGSSWQQAMIAHVWGGETGSGNEAYLFADPASGTDAAGNLITTTYNDFAHLRWLGSRRMTTPYFSSDRVGQWHCVEARVRLNDAGQANGIFQTWVNGVYEAGRTDLNWVGSYNAYGINGVFVENYWNTGSPVAQERYIDDFVVSTQRIGC